MLISRQLAHKLTTHLQVILSAIELGRNELAIKHVRDASELVMRHTETEAEELERKRHGSEG